MQLATGQITERPADQRQRPAISIRSEALDLHRAANRTAERSLRRKRIPLDARSARPAMARHLCGINADQPDTLPAAAQRVSVYGAAIVDRRQ
jgi:hypothetical protein